MILAALFCNFSIFCLKTVPQEPQYGATISKVRFYEPKYNILRVALGKSLLAYLTYPDARTLLDDT